MTSFECAQKMTSFECVQEARQWLEFYRQDRENRFWALELAETWLALSEGFEQVTEAAQP
jgi:hypothetical protein